MDALKTLVIRSDGSAEIGMGHITRCLALARGLRKSGVRSLFVVRDYDPKVTDVIQRHDFTVATIPHGSHRDDDLRLTLEYAGKYGAKLVVADLGNVEALAYKDKYAAYLQGLKDAGKYLVAIDDIIYMSLPADIIINPHYGVDKGSYAGGTARLLLGPAYFLFSPEFIAAAGRKRKIREEADNVLVSLGGSDPLDCTGKVVKALADSPETRRLNLRIVLGMDAGEEKKKETEALLQDYPGSYELIQGADNMAELLTWSDITVTGGGLTRYEAAVTGTPIITIPQYDYLVKLAADFAVTGASLDLGFSGTIAGETIAAAVAGLLKDTARRREMSRRGRALVDGRGIERILAEIPEGAWS